jgi:hypothetical protein
VTARVAAALYGRRIVLVCFGKKRDAALFQEGGHVFTTESQLLSGCPLLAFTAAVTLSDVPIFGLP